MRSPLETKRGRLATFFFLYVTEGIPLGFCAGAIAFYLRNQGLSPSQISAFVASFYLPWGFKWAMGPFVDVFYSDRFGRRRLWIICCQLLMIGTLLSALPIDFVKNLGLFTGVILVHNVFGASQDVAIDALAVSVLKEDERGIANGFMFAGASVGYIVGDSGVLYLAPLIGFKSTFLFVGGAIFAVTALVAWRIKEVPTPRAAATTETGALARVGAEIRDYAMTAAKAMFANRAALTAFGFAVLPAGSMALTSAMQKSLAAEFGLSQRAAATLSLISTLTMATGCVVGGFLSDRFGRRRMIALYIGLTILPTLALAVTMVKANWIMPIDVKAANRPFPPGYLMVTFVAASIVFAAFHGLLYGTRTALFMDVCDPKIAATHFTAYMSILNLVIAYSIRWEGWAAVKWGYPTTFVLDAAFGLVCLAFLPFMVKAPSTDDVPKRDFEVVSVGASA
jgi:PAT family beta-lactamase induction signal transducer AmpG